MLRVIYRCCDKVEAVNGLPRPFKLDKEKTLKVCFKSLVMSLVDKEHTVHVIGDRLSEDTISFMKSLHEEAEIDNSSEALGNGKSILKCFELAETFDDNDIIYFCEDDYLHFYPNFYDKITDFLIVLSFLSALFFYIIIGSKKRVSSLLTLTQFVQCLGDIYNFSGY